jgi:hypothetical protein
VPIVPAAPILLQNEPSGTSKTTARFSWSDGENGGKVITDYKIYSDNASGNWAEIASGITERVYTASGLSSGLIYKFKVQARNSVGFGPLSEAVSILTAVVPDAPDAPTTSTVANDVLVQWISPSADSLNEYGAAISGYKVLIQTSTGVDYYEELVHCDGSDPAIIAGLFCTIPMSTLQGAPFMLSLGASVYAKVAAINQIGNSLESLPGNGATITLSFVPDAPINLKRNELLTTRTQISFTWENGLSNGGQPIIDYRVTYD